MKLRFERAWSRGGIFKGQFSQLVVMKSFLQSIQIHFFLMQKILKVMFLQLQCVAENVILLSKITVTEELGTEQNLFVLLQITIKSYQPTTEMTSS